MSEHEQRQNEHDPERPGQGPVTITVNSQPVVMPDKHTTAAAIKDAAVAAGVPIQLDFVLSEVRPNGEQKVLSDEKHISLKDGDEFWAIPGDDNS